MSHSVTKKCPLCFHVQCEITSCLSVYNCILGVYSVTVMDMLNFKFNDIKSLYTKIDSERRRSIIKITFLYLIQSNHPSQISWHYNHLNVVLTIVKEILFLYWPKK